MQAKYLNPFTDFGFKKIFGEEASKPLLMDFLNALLPPENQIANLSFKNPEQLGQTDLDRKAIYDIYCENQNGEKFIVELQKAKQNYFKERTVYYSTFPIREQAEKGNWDFNLKAVYCIGILDFTFGDYETEPEKTEVVHTIKLKNQHGKVFYDKLTYIYLEMPNFKLAENQLKTRLDKWLFFIQHLEDFQAMPSIFKDDIFSQAFETAELSNLPRTELDKYENSLKIYRDLKNVIDTAFGEGQSEGFEAGVEKGIDMGIDIGIAKGRLEGLKEGELKGLEEGKLKGLEEGKLKGLEEGKLKGLEEGKLKGLEEGKLKGLEEGKLKERLALAKNLKNEGATVEFIMKVTGLSKEEIEGL